MNIVVRRPKTSFPRGLGAANDAIASPIGGSQHSTLRRVYNPTAIQQPKTGGNGTWHGPTRTTIQQPVVVASTPDSTVSTTTGEPTHHRRRRGSSQQQQGQYQSGQYQSGQTATATALNQGSTSPSAATLSAFQQALAAAAAAGVISSSDVLSYQAQANGATDAQLQSLTSQLTAAASSATASAAIAPTSPTASPVATATSWWDGTTSIGGYSVGNTTMVLGGLFILGLGYVFVSNKKR